MGYLKNNKLFEKEVFINFSAKEKAVGWIAIEAGNKKPPSHLHRTAYPPNELIH